MFAGGDGSTLSLDFTTMSGLDSRFTFSRASTATFINSSGLVQFANANLMTYSNPRQTGTAWGSVGTVTWGSSTLTDPTGGSNAQSVTFGTAASAMFNTSGTTVVSGITHTFSVWLRSATGTTTVRIGDANVAPVATVTLTTTWQRFSCQYTTSGTNDGGAIYSQTGTPSAEFYVWGAQVQPGAVVGDLIETSGTIDRNVPRFDHDPSTLAPKGLLLEGSATNLLEYSETFDSPWALGNVQRSTTQSTTAPDGTTVFAIETISTASTTFLRSVGVITGATATFPVTFSYWFKAGNVVQPSNSSTDQSAGRRFAIYTLSPTTPVWEIRIDGQDPTSYTVVTGSGTYEAVPYPNGWYRCRLTATVATGDSVRVYLGSVGNPVSAAGLYWYVWGAQLEKEVSGASSYIPTGANAEQRAADVCEFPFDPATYGYNTDPNHTFALGWNIGVGTTSGFPGLFDIRDVGGNRCHGFTINNAANPTHFSQAGVTAGSVTTVGLTNRPIGVNRKLAASVIDGATGHNFSIDGVAGTPQAVTSAVLRVPTRVGSPGVQIPSATLQFVKFYPFAMTSAQLDAITS